MHGAHGKPVASVGLISDTHGLLRREALAALEGSDVIVHAGDIGDASILAQLSAIAPVCAVRGNNDVGAWACDVPHERRLDVGGKSVFVIHDIAELTLDPATEGIDVIVSGHSHRPKTERRDGVLYVNPGSAGPRRFRLPISVGKLLFKRDRIEAELVTLDVPPAPATVRRVSARPPR
jgi:putative phosphoesterase